MAVIPIKFFDHCVEGPVKLASNNPDLIENYNEIPFKTVSLESFASLLRIKGEISKPLQRLCCAH